MQHEVEWQFDAEDAEHLAEVRAWLQKRASKSDLKLGEPTTHVFHDRYLDTDDWRFFRAGFALRVREHEGGTLEATLKSLDAADQGARVRRELREKLTRMRRSADFAALVVQAEGEVGQLVRAVVGNHALRVCFVLRTQREVFPLHVDGAAAEVALDETHFAHDGKREAQVIYRIEVEAAPDVGDHALKALTSFVDALRDKCDLEPSRFSKFELGLRAYKLKPQDYKPDLGTPATAKAAGEDPELGVLALAVLREHFAAFLHHEPGARLGISAEGVHRMRVATRRLRAALRFFRDALPASAQHFREELRWVTDALGAVRDLDVQRERLEQWHAQEPKADLTALNADLSRRWQEARARMLEALDSARFAQFVGEMSAWLRAPDDLPLLARQSARALLPALLMKRYAAVRVLGDAITAESPAESYHALRIQVKRLRYALESAACLYPKVAESFVPRLIALQDLLGEHHDAHVALEQLRAVAQSAALAESNRRALDKLARHYARQAAKAVECFPDAYQRICGKAWVRVLREIDEA
ncbi:MAG: CHAD domain-containing protein [Thermoflexales bacterium]|nr:CHAD domain-containing protein [Thermoflexales bacterium]